ncbi:MAG: alginate export family protein [Candidatus Omnitrophota bacterium]
MSKKLLVCMAVLSFTLIGTTFAAVENIKVSGDMTAAAVTRDLGMGVDVVAPGVGGSSADAGDFLMSQIRLRFDADLTENVSVVVGLINERLWGSETDANGSSEDAEIDLDLGYVELKEFLYDPLSITVGRQPLRYGSGLIVGDPDTNMTAAVTRDGGNTSNVPAAISDLSMRKSFDAVKAVLDYAPYTVDLVYSKVDEGAISVNDDITLMGANVAYMWDSYNGLTEGYFFSSVTENLIGASVSEMKSKTYVLGLRSQLDINDHLTLSGESAYQFGDHYNAESNDASTLYSHRKAWAALASAEYRLLNDYNAKFGGGYTFLSGDDANSKGFEGWDPMFEDTTCGELINVLFAASNCHLFNFNSSYMPREDVTLSLNYCRAILAEKLPGSSQVDDLEGNAQPYATYTPIAGPASGYTYAVNSDKKVMGDEIDVAALYDYTEDVQLKLTGAWFLPGGYFEGPDNRESAYSVKGGLTVNF